MKLMKYVASMAVSASLLFGATGIVAGNQNMVKVQSPKKVHSVYLGSFLAQGHLGAKNIYRIDAPVGGVVKYLAVNIFQSVHKGQQLLIIKSPKLLELESNYIDMLIEKEYYENEVARLKPLYERAVIAKKVFFKATNTLEKYKTQVDFYHNLLIEWGLSPKQVMAITLTKTPIPEIIIESPIDGKVDDLQVYPKMYAERGAHLMTILNPDKAHFEVAMPLDIAKILHVGSKLFIEDKPVEVESISSTINPRTQTIAIHLVPKVPMHILPNEKRNIKLFLPHSAYVVPASAVIDIDEKPAIFVKVPQGFKALHVTVLGRSSEKVYIQSEAITDKTRIAVSDVIALKGELEGGGDD